MYSRGRKASAPKKKTLLTSTKPKVRSGLGRGAAQPKKKIKNPFPKVEQYQSEFGNEEQVQEQLADMWKVFGRDTKAGRDLYKMYGAGHKKRINYPKPKTKKWDPKEARKIPKRPCPQQAKVEYPPVMTPAKLLARENRKKFSKLDLVPKRKGKEEILEELRERKTNVYVPVNTGKDRALMRDNLQENFQYAEDKKYQDIYQVTDEEEKAIQRALAAKLRQESNKNYFFKMVEQKEEGPNFGKNVDQKIVNPRLRELTGIFDAVIEEIEERQGYLAEIENLDMDKARKRVKAEILDRVSELDKINKMIKEEKQKNGNRLI